MQKKKEPDMILKKKNELIMYLEKDATANYRESIKPNLFGDEIWKFIIALRKLEYYSKGSTLLDRAHTIYWKFQHHRRQIRCGYLIPINVFGPGLGLPHRGTIVVNSTAKVGKNCRIHQGVTIGSTSGSKESAIIGDNVFIGANASIIGGIKIADNVAIGANSLVIKDIDIKGTTWGGVPAHIISDNNSFSQLPPKLVETIVSGEQMRE